MDSDLGDHHCPSHPFYPATQENLAAVKEGADPEATVLADRVRDLVTDKGYHSNDTPVALARPSLRSDVPEPDRGRRCWEGKAQAQAAV